MNDSLRAIAVGWRRHTLPQVAVALVNAYVQPQSNARTKMIARLKKLLVAAAKRSDFDTIAWTKHRLEEKFPLVYAKRGAHSYVGVCWPDEGVAVAFMLLLPFAQKTSLCLAAEIAYKAHYRFPTPEDSYEAARALLELCRAAKSKGNTELASDIAIKAVESLPDDSTQLDAAYQLMWELEDSQKRSLKRCLGRVPQANSLEALFNKLMKAKRATPSVSH